MRSLFAVLMTGALLAACATASEQDGLPLIRYADAASRGGVYTVTTPRPAEGDVRRADALWRRALGEASACRLPRLDVVRTAMAGAVELATMTALARDGDGQVDDQVLRGLARTLLGELMAPGDRPSAARCRTVDRWGERVREDASDSVARAIAKGLAPLL